MNEIIPKFTALSQLFGCYFHQDWVDEFDDDLAALNAIIKSEPAEQIAIGLEEIEQILRVEYSEDDLRNIMTNKVGCYFDPTSLNMTYVDWLSRVRDALSNQ